MMALERWAISAAVVVPAPVVAHAWANSKIVSLPAVVISPLTQMIARRRLYR